MTARDRLALAAAAATALACAALGPLYAGRAWVLPVLGAVLVVAAAGAAAARARVPALLVPVPQVAALVAYAALLYLPDLLGAPSTAAASARLLLEDAALGVAELAPPVPATRPSLVLLGVLGAGAVAVVVDLLAVGLRRAALAGLPLLVLLAVPSGLLPGGLGWVPFTLGAGGWLLLLHVEGEERVSRWGTVVAGRRASTDGSPSGRVGRRIGAAALGSAVLVPALVPGLDARLLPGTGGGADGDRTTTTYNPITRLQDQLTLPDPEVLLTYRTTDPAPDYVRLTTLDLFSGSGWSSSNLSGSELDGPLDAPVGTAGAETREVEVTVSLADELESQWLPLPSAPREVEVDGTWLWDVPSQTVYSVKSNTLRIDEYAAQVQRVLPEPAELAESGSVPVTVAPYAEVPEVSEYSRGVTEQVVAAAGAETRYEQAVALQQFFRSGAFTYDLRTAPFSGDDALGGFLQGRRGFCEQFASAMAAMLRVLEIPARVAVGFTPGALQPDGTRVLTTSDAHAWPEAWFPEAGWVRFEPTPTSDAREEVPEYSLEEAVDEAVDTPVPGATASASPVPTSGPAGGTSADREDRLAEDGSGAAAPDEDGLGAARTALLVLGGAALLLAPAGLAALRRRRRWSAPGPLVAWQQVQEDAADLGVAWSAADTPRGAAARLTRSVPLGHVPSDALGRLAQAVERVRYAPSGGPSIDPDVLRGDVALVREALEDAAPRGRVWRARLAPPSTVRWAASTSGRLVADLLDRVDDVVAGVSRGVTRRLRRTG